MSNNACCLSKLLRLSVAGEFDENTSCTNGQRIRGHMLAGPNSCGKTSLLFEYAITCAENGDYVLFIAPKPLIRLPLFVNGRKQPSTVVLKRINMVYLANYDELVDYFANAHLNKLRNSPVGQSRHVLIDDFDWYFREKGTRMEDTNRLAKCMAYMIDALNFWFKNMQSSPEAKCSVLLAETVQGDLISAEKLGLYKHWITDFIKIQKLGNSLFRIQPIEHDKNFGSLSSELTLHYEINDNAITVKRDGIDNLFIMPEPQAEPFED